MDKLEAKYTDTKTEVSEAVELPSPLHLVEFSNGNIKREGGKHLQYQSNRSSELNSLSRPKRILVASNQNLQFIGSNYESDMSQITSSVLKIGVYNNHSRKMKLYDADFYRMKPVVKYDFDATVTDRSWSEKSEDLALAFGSKMKKRMINSRLKYESVGSDTIVSAISTEFFEGELKRTNAPKFTQEAEVIPPQNKTAISVDEVYNIYDVISEEEYCALDSTANTFTNVSHEIMQTWKNDKKFCTFIIHCLEINFKSLSLHKAKLLCYLDYMICFLKKSYKDFRKKDPAPEVPQPFRKKLMEKYLENRSMPQRMKDKLLAHAMVLALMANNYHIDGRIWAASTLIPMKRLVLVAYVLGCHVSERKNQETKVIELKLPLYKYEPRDKQKK